MEGVDAAKERTSGPMTWALLVIPVLGVLLLVFLPVVLIAAYEPGGSSLHGSRGEEEAAVGIAVILRATARRLLRTASSSVIRTTVGTISRTAARTFTRQVLRFSMRILGAGVVKNVVDQESGRTGIDTGRRSWVSLLVGLVVLALSFWGVVARSDGSLEASLTVDRGLDLLTVSLLAALPLLVYAGINLVVGRLLGVVVAFETAVDGVLLQAYFTGSGSFLPMTTDVVYEGTDTQRAKLSIASIGGLFLCHILLATAFSGSPVAVMASNFFLVYCFVFAFPIKPLEGWEVWNRSKLLWVVVWGPILYSFVKFLPADFASVL